MGVIMTNFKNIVLALLASTAIFSGLNCKNPLFDPLKKKYPTATKQDTLLGLTLFSTGLHLAHFGYKKHTMPSRIFFRYPALGFTMLGIGCIGNSFNEKYKWLR